jgi:hypothetical protein
MEDKMRIAKLVSLPVLLGLLAASPLATPVVAQASTMLLSSRVFPSGALAPNGIAGTERLISGSSVTLTAPEYLYVPGTSTTTPSGYAFMFWDADSTLSTKNTVKFTAPAAGEFYARAWYESMCVPGDGPCSGGGSGVDMWAFSLTANRPMKQSPIATVTPASAQTGPKSVSTAAGAVTITAAGKLGTSALSPGLLPPYYAFNSLFQFGGDGTIAGPTLTVPAKGASAAIAFYNYVPGFHPPHCFPGPPPNCL